MQQKSSNPILFSLLVVMLASSVAAFFEKGPNNLLGNFKLISKRHQPSILSSPTVKTNSKQLSAGKSSKRRLNPSQNKSISILNAPCPGECVCQGLSVDCSSRGLKQIPKNIPTNAIRL